MRTLFLILVILLVHSSQGQAEETSVIGVWRDRIGPMWDMKIEILKRGEKYFARRTTASTMRDPNKTFSQNLIKKFSKQYQKDAYFIVNSSDQGGLFILDNGDLELFDKEGKIRVAKKIAR